MLLNEVGKVYQMIVTRKQVNGNVIISLIGQLMLPQACIGLLDFRAWKEGITSFIKQ